MQKLLILTCAILCQAAHAESFYGYGLGVSRSAAYSPAETKLVYVGYRDRLLPMISRQCEAGMWFDSAGHGRNSSAYAAYSFGVEVDAGYLTLRSTHGLALITGPDVYLGGSFPQFLNTLGASIRGSNGGSIGVGYRHVSSAGIHKNNTGRDFVTVEIGVNW